MENENTQPVEGMEQEAPVSTPEESTSSFSFVSDEEIAQMNQPQEQLTQEAAPEVEQQQEIIEEPTDAQPEAQQEYAPEEVETAVFEFLSERLGRNVTSIDDFQAQHQEQREVDESILLSADLD